MPKCAFGSFPPTRDVVALTCSCAEAEETNILRSNMKKLFSALSIVVFCAAVLIPSQAARAVNGVWAGTTDGNWSVNTNWTLVSGVPTPPTAGGNVTFNGNTTGPAANMIMNNDLLTSIGLITVGAVPGG